MKKLLAAVAAAACALTAGLTACSQPEETGTYSVEAELSCYNIGHGRHRVRQTPARKDGIHRRGGRFAQHHAAPYKEQRKDIFDRVLHVCGRRPARNGNNNKGSLKNGTIGIYDGDGSLLRRGCLTPSAKTPPPTTRRKRCITWTASPSPLRKRGKVICSRCA